MAKVNLYEQAQKRRQRHILRMLLKCTLFTSAAVRRSSKEMLYCIYSELGRCPGYSYLVALYPSFLHAHHACLSFLLLGEGPLPVDIRFMIAIMAASRHRCHALVSRFAAILLQHYGDAPLDEEYADAQCLQSGFSYSSSTNLSPSSCSCSGKAQMTAEKMLDSNTGMERRMREH
uniref:Sestrin n=1 Tax=Lygus hesperus TaxID=30085 RepID=A0A0A9WG88_LYGHE